MYINRLQIKWGFNNKKYTNKSTSKSVYLWCLLNVYLLTTHCKIHTSFSGIKSVQLEIHRNHLRLHLSSCSWKTRHTHDCPVAVLVFILVLWKQYNPVGYRDYRRECVKQIEHPTRILQTPHERLINYLGHVPAKRPVQPTIQQSIYIGSCEPHRVFGCLIVCLLVCLSTANQAFYLHTNSNHVLALLSVKLLSLRNNDYNLRFTLWISITTLITFTEMQTIMNVTFLENKQLRSKHQCSATADLERTN
jgi:hypothetical protein